MRGNLIVSNSIMIKTIIDEIIYYLHDSLETRIIAAAFHGKSVVFVCILAYLGIFIHNTKGHV